MIRNLKYIICVCLSIFLINSNAFSQCADFADVEIIMNTSCNFTGCHTGALRPLTYANILTMSCAPDGTSGFDYFLDKIEGTSGCGGAMPQGSTGLDATNPADFACIQEWINNGAREFSNVECSNEATNPGVAIVEILPDPNSASSNVDVNCDGIADAGDDYVKICNNSSADIDISGFQIYDNAAVFTFPAGTILAAGDCAIVVDEWPASSGPIPTNYFSGGVPLNNGGDQAILYDPNANTYQSVVYNGFALDTNVLPLGAVSACDENWGSDTDGQALTNNGAITPVLPAACPSCPDLTTILAGDLVVGVTESTCEADNTTLSGGVIAAPTTACPTGSTLEYSIDGGTAWSTTLPTYNQTTAVTVTTRCLCDIDGTTASATSEVTTVPGTCPVGPTCDPIVVDATSSCNADGTYNIDIISITGGIATTADFNVTANGTTISYPAVTSIANQTYVGGTSGEQLAIMLTIEDADDVTCATTFNVFELNCLEQEVCDCTSATPYTINVQATGNADGYQMVYALVNADGTLNAINQTGTFTALPDDGAMYNVYAFNVIDTEVTGFITDATTDITTAISANNALVMSSDGITPYCYEVAPAVAFTESCVCCDPAIAVATAPAVVVTSESTCEADNVTLSGGVISAPATACPTGSTLEYSIDGGTVWSTTLPVYDQTTAITVTTRCLCDVDATIASATSMVTTVPDVCILPVEIAITDPCNCIDGIDLDGDFQNDILLETITITATAGQTITLTTAGGLVTADGTTPASGTATDNGNGTYTFTAYITASTPYTAEFTITGGGANDGAMPSVIGGNCTPCPAQVANDCNCGNDPTPFTINTVANASPSDKALIYTLTGNGDPLETATPAAGSPASFTGLADNTAFEVCAFDVDADDLVAFNAAMISEAAVADAQAGTGAFAGLCYEYVCTTYNEDCACAVCPDLTGIAVGDLNVTFTNSACNTVGGNTGQDVAGTTTAPTTTCPVGSTLQYSTDGGLNWVTTLPIYDDANAITIDTRCLCDLDMTTASAVSTVTTNPGECPLGTPSIMIVKDDADNADDTQNVMSGADATFTITVTNNGSADLTNVVITDAITVSCAMDATMTATAISAVGNLDAVFNVGESFTYNCSTTGGVTMGFVNEATVTANDVNDPNTQVTDTDDTEVLVIQNNVCDCSAAPQSYTINTVASNQNQDGYTLVYVLVDASGAIVATPQTPAAQQPASFTGLADNAAYTVYAFNVLDSEVAGFEGDVLLDINEAIAGNLDDVNGNVYCYTFEMIMFPAEDCQCCPDDIVATITGDNSVCADATTSNLTITITGGGTGPYSITYTDGAANIPLFGVNSGDVVTVSPTTTTSYSLLSVVDESGTGLCTGTVNGTATITVITPPNAGMNGTATACSNSADGNTIADLSAALMGAPDAGGSWAETTTSGVDLTDPTMVDFDGVAVGAYTFEYTVTATSPCVDAVATVTVTVNDCNTCPNDIAATLAGDASVCADDTASDLTVTIAGSGVGPYTIVYNDGTTDITVTNYNSGDAIAVAPADDTTYTMVSVTDANGCTGTVSGTATITVNDLPTFTLMDQTICLGESVTLMGPDGLAVYAWSTSETTQDITVSPAVTTTYTLDVVDGNGCEGTDDVTVTVITPPNAGNDGLLNVCNATADGSIADLAAVLGGVEDAGGAWAETSASGVDISNPMMVDFDGIAEGTYTFTYTAAGTSPCVDDVATVTVVVADCTVEVFDLALTKDLLTAGPYTVGQEITFVITVYNQGNVEATLIDVTDYVPAGLNFDPANTTAYTWSGMAGDVVTTTQIASIPAGGSAQVEIDLVIDASAVGAGQIINNAEITDARDENGDVAVDEDSTPGDNSNTDPEIGSDNDINDDSTGGSDNPADSDDYDPAFFTLEEEIPLVDTVCNCDGSNATLSAAAQPGSFNEMNTQVYVLVDNATGLVVQVSNDGIYTDVPTGTYSMYALNYDQNDANVQTVLDNLVLGATFNLVVGTSDDPCYDLQVTQGFVNQCIPDLADITNPALCADATTIDLATYTPAELNGVSGSGEWTDIMGEPLITTNVTVGDGATFTYTFTSDEGCVEDITIVFTVNPLPQITASATDATCTQGGSITITIDTGVSYTYSVGGGAPVAITASPVEDLNAGTYTITATDDNTGCSDSDTVTIGTSDDIPTIDVIVSNETCDGPGSISINNPQAGITYTINGVTTNLADLAAGTYEVVAANPVTGCEAMQNITIGSDVVTVAVSAQATDATCTEGGTITIDNPQTGVTYTINGVAGTSLSNVPAGTYTITATDDATNCSGTNTVTVGANAEIPTIDYSVLQPTCDDLAGGEITVTPETDVTYTITGGSFTGLMAGNYVITATNDVTGCANTTLVAIIEPSDCGEQVISVLDVCPCNGDEATIIAVAEDGTFASTDDAGNTYSQTYILVQGGTIIAIATDGTFPNLADGSYEVYALNYQDSDAPAFAEGDAIDGLVNGTVTGCYDLSAPAMGSVNGVACGCGVDCSTFVDPSVDNITVCEGGDTEIFPTDNNGGGTSGTPFTVTWDFEGELVGGVSDNVDVMGSDATLGAGLNAAGFPAGNGGGDALSSSDWEDNEATDYFEFCVSSSQSLVINTLSFFDDASGSGPDTYEVYTSADGYTNAVASGSTNLSFVSTANEAINLNFGVAAGATACFRIYGVGASSSGGTWRVDDVIVSGEVGATASPVTFEYYDAATGGNLLGTGNSFDPSPAAGITSTIYVVATDGFCTSAAIPVTVTVDAQPFAGADSFASVCSNSAEGNTVIDIATLLDATADDNGTWLDFVDMPLSTTEINLDGTFTGAYNYQYIVPANGACEGDTAVFTITVQDCNFCAGFEAPDAIDPIAACSSDEIIISPTGGGINGNGNTAFISEIHYDDAGSDEGEAIEISGPVGSLDCYALYLYNGSNGAEYNEVFLGGNTIADQSNGYGAISFPISGIQNGPDGIALVDTCSSTIIEFISYGGVLQAVDGPAAGLQTTDILVAQDGEPEGSSLELTNDGWISNDTNSFGIINAGLQITGDVPVSGYTFTDPSGNVTENVSELTVTEAGTYTIIATGSGCVSEPITVDVSINEGPVFTLSAPCDASGTINGPEGDYTYEWVDAEGNLVANTADYMPGVAGIFTLTVTDNGNGCSASQMVEVTDTPDISIESQVACVGETITLTAPDGYSYEWSNGETTSSITVTNDDVANGFGSFTVTLTNAADCEYTATAFAVFNSVPSVDAGEDIFACGGDAITLTASSDDPNATFEWSTGETTASISVTPNGTATYTVTVFGITTISGTDYICSASDDVTVSVGDAPTAGADVAATVCNNAEEGNSIANLTELLEGADTGGIFTDADGNAAASLFDANGFATGTYTFTYTVGGTDACPEDAAEITITVEDCLVTGAPAILIVKDDADNQNDFQTIYSGGTATFTITVTNIGTEPLSNIVVSDPLSPNCDAVYQFDPLMPGDLFSYECTIDNVTEDFINVATVTATGTDSGEEVTDDDDTYVNVVLEPCPEIMIAGAGIGELTACAGEMLDLEVIVDNADEDDIIWSTGEMGVTMISIEAMENTSCDIMTMEVSATIPAGAEYCTEATSVTFEINVLPDPNNGVELFTAEDGCSVGITACEGSTITHVVNGQIFTGDSYTADAGESGEVIFYVENACGISEGIIGSVDCADDVCDTPISAEIITECSEDGSTYSLAILISGGSGTYNVSGTLNEEGVSAGLTVIGSFPDQTPYNFVIADPAGVCPSLALSGQPGECSKSCDDIVLEIENPCNSGGTAYNVIGSIIGGEAPYTITVNGETQTVEEGFSFGPYDNLTNYTVLIVDANDCEVTYGGPIVDCTVTAIELITFEGEVERERNNVFWTTATENENDFFTLERSFNGIDFEVITYVNGAGNSSTPSAYNFMDIEAQTGENFYRLKATDFEGNTEVVSEVIKLVRVSEETIISVRPVPTSATLYIDYQATVSNTVFVTVYDVTGKVVEYIETDVEGGENTLILDVQDYTIGTYFITLQDGNSVVNTKFIKH